MGLGALGRGGDVMLTLRIDVRAERLHQSAIVVHQKRRNLSKPLGPFRRRLRDVARLIRVLIEPIQAFFQVSQFHIHGDVVRPRFEEWKVRINGGRGVMEQHARHGKL